MPAGTYAAGSLPSSPVAQRKSSGQRRAAEAHMSDMTQAHGCTAIRRTGRPSGMPRRRVAPARERHRPRRRHDRTPRAHAHTYVPSTAPVPVRPLSARSQAFLPIPAHSKLFPSPVLTGRSRAPIFRMRPRETGPHRGPSSPAGRKPPLFDIVSPLHHAASWPKGQGDSQMIKHDEIYRAFLSVQFVRFMLDVRKGRQNSTPSAQNFARAHDWCAGVSADGTILCRDVSFYPDLGLHSENLIGLLTYRDLRTFGNY